MIPIAKNEFWTNREGLVKIKKRIAENTCKTNLNPELMFRQSYTGLTKKLFVGNWTTNGFWISKFRMQLAQIRPDIIMRFRITQDRDIVKVSLKSSVGFSSIFTYFLLALIAFTFIANTGLIGFTALLTVFSFAYILLTRMEYRRMLENVKKTIVGGITITKSNFDIWPENEEKSKINSQ